jgi:Zn-dependent peptidase ImmA (M78 family)
MMSSMTETDVLLKARQFVVGLDLTNIGSDLGVYINKAGASVRYEELPLGESGYSLQVKGAWRIVANSLETPERQRFTICHEIAHIALGLPSSHDEVKSWAFAKRDINETWCDLFAAELLLPMAAFKAAMADEEPSFELVEVLAKKFNASFPAAASRLATLADSPVAFVTMDRGVIRHAARSTSLRKVNAWIAPKSPVPAGSVAHALRAAQVNGYETQEVAQDVWFAEWEKGSDLWEMSRHYARFDQTVSLLWFDEEDLPDADIPRFKAATSEDEGLSELTGELPWPGKKRRR